MRDALPSRPDDIRVSARQLLTLIELQPALLLVHRRWPGQQIGSSTCLAEIELDDRRRLYVRLQASSGRRSLRVHVEMQVGPVRIYSEPQPFAGKRITLTQLHHHVRTALLEMAEPFS
jgi:hypothetical protein